MKFKGFWYDGLLISLAAAASAVFTVITALFEPRLAIAEGFAFLIVCVIAVYRALSAKKRYKRFKRVRIRISKFFKRLCRKQENGRIGFPFHTKLSNKL